MSLHGGPLPTSEDLVVEDAELRSILALIAKRSAGGRAVSGRYNKHDTARLRFIRSIALPGIRLESSFRTTVCACCDSVRRLCCVGRILHPWMNGLSGTGVIRGARRRMAGSMRTSRRRSFAGYPATSGTIRMTITLFVVQHCFRTGCHWQRVRCAIFASARARRRTNIKGEQRR